MAQAVPRFERSSGFETNASTLHFALLFEPGRIEHVNFRTPCRALRIACDPTLINDWIQSFIARPAIIQPIPCGIGADNCTDEFTTAELVATAVDFKRRYPED